MIRSLASLMRGMGTGRHHVLLARRIARMRIVRFCVVAVAVTMAAGMASPSAQLATVHVPGPNPPVQKPVPVHAVHGHKVQIPKMIPWRRPTTHWPRGTAVVALPTARQASVPRGNAALAVPGAGAVQAGGLPIWVRQAAGPILPSRLSTSAAEVRVSVAARSVAQAAGVRGMVFAVSSVDGQAVPDRLHLTVGYSGFAYAYGGDYAARLHLVELPTCALTTPQAAACRTQTPLASANDVKAEDLGADVTVAGGSATQAPLVLAATSSPSGSAGDFTATSLSEAGQWSSGGSNGSFDYSYPVQVPPVPGGLAPKVSLGYDSQAVDGLTSSTNNQASEFGDGWGYAPGSIERSYPACSQVSSHKTGDLCQGSNEVTTLSLGGQDTTLVQDGGTGTTWHAEVDNNEKVQYLTGAGNASNGGGYWKITEPDGTQYFFGQDQLPGWATGGTSDVSTKSAWNVPVYATDSSQACYSATWASSFCYLPWRWNLDYVVDPHGDAIAYFYNYEQNYYARNSGTTADTAYVQGGVLTSVEYGLRAGSVYGATPAAEVNFANDESRTDFPSDLACANGASCSVISPSFWSKYEITSISTKALNGTALGTVDTWTLAHSYPNTTDTTSAPSLWLSSITRKGEDGTEVPMLPVSFAGTPLPNRIESAAERSDGYSIITRLRLTSVTNETGGVTTVNYLAPSGGCTSGSLPAPDANTLLCYPDYWTPSGMTSPILDWFNKYVVNEVTEQDTTGDGLPVVTNYSYGGAAWHYNDDALVRSKNRTWDQWRGFRTVTTYTGPATAPDTKTVDTYFQGMNGDYQSDGTTTSVSLTSTQGDTTTDSDQFAGMDFEHVVDNGPSGGMVTDKITIPWSSAATATQSQPSPLPALTAHLTGTAETKTFTALASGGNREATETFTHDSDGRVVTDSTVPDTSDASEDTCATTTYADNTTAWILDLPDEVNTVSVPCGATVALPADAVSDTRTFYDGSSTLGAAPTAGNVTMTQQVTAYTGTTPTWTTESASSYDEYGRVLKVSDADNRPTTTAYTPATGAEPTSVTVTDPMGMGTTTTYDPARDLPLTVKNPAGLVTTKQYDALGRLTAAWTPGHGTGGNAQYKFTYNVRNTAPSVVTTLTLELDGQTYLPAETFYDSLGRSRETQDENGNGNTVVSDTTYNADGWKVKTSNPYFTSGTPTSTLVAAPDDQVPSQTVYIYDGTGRVTQQQSFELANETWETDTAYGGNDTTVSYKNLKAGEPDGGTPQTTFTNGEGKTTKIYQYHAGVPADPADPASDYDATVYTYTPAGKLATIADAAGNHWSYLYDLMGNQYSQTDPDTGTATSSYDAAGQLMSVTDARQDQTSYTYDGDGRKTAEYDTTNGAPESSTTELASWAYDTLAKGQLTSSTSYYSGQAYTVAITGYDGFGLPFGTETTIPGTPGTPGTLAGNYIQQYTYNSADGLETGYTDSAAAGLPQETVGYGYDAASNPTSVTGIWSYVGSLSYYDLGQPKKFTYGSSSEPAWTVDSYDEQTGALTEQQTQTGTTPVTVDDQHYSYDNTGQVLSDADTPAAGPAQVQCFTYDYLGRLSQAWSQGTSSCTGGASQSAEAGAAAPYWDQYSYFRSGDMNQVVSTPSTGAATTITNSFPAAGSAQSHAVSSQSVAAPSGTTSTSYTYDAAGHLATVTGSQSQNLNWDHAGRLSSDSGTNYIYDANGSLLIRQDPGSSTLYLGDEEITLDTASGTLSGTRYYSIGGQNVAARTSVGQVQYLAGDTQGTQTTAIDSATLNVTRRYYDPFGNPVSPAPAGWPGQRGFQNGTTDTATSLTNLGAREYQAGTASFISPDPLLSPYIPQDLNPYAYSADMPPTGEDPTGASSFITDGCYSNCQTHTTSSNHNPNGGGKTPSGNSDGVIQISQNVYVAANDPQAQVLKVAWRTVTHRFGAPTSAGGEFSDWWHLCALYPGTCKGSFAHFFGGMPDFTVQTAFASDIKLVFRASGGALLGMLVPLAGKIQNPVQKYEVGIFKDLRSRSVPRDGFDIHHVPQGKPASQVIQDYDYINAPAIALPNSEHKFIPTQKGAYTGDPKALIQKDIQDLRDYTNVPDTQIQALEDLINSTYPGLLGDSAGESAGAEGAGAGGE